MKKNLALTLCLLTGAIYAGSSIPDAIADPVPTIIAQQESPQPEETSPQPEETSPQPSEATPQPSETPTRPSQTPTRPSTSSKAVVLTLQDMPPGFQEVPPQMTANFVETLKKQVGQVSVNPENLFAFMTQSTSSSTSSSPSSTQTSSSASTTQSSSTESSSQSAQVVVGYTGSFPDQASQDSFDATLKKLQQPDYQKQMIDQMREGLKNSAGIEVQEYSMIPELNNFAEASTGMSVKILLAGQPMRIDIVSFRRKSLGALTAIMYPDGQPPKITLTEVARKLDTRMSQP